MHHVFIQDDKFLTKECGTIQNHNDIETLQYNTVFSGFKTIYFQFSWCLQDKRKDKYSCWELHDLNISTAILHFMSYISYCIYKYSFEIKFLNLITNIVLEDCVLQATMCFPLGLASSFQHCPKGYGNIRKVHFLWHQAPPFKVSANWIPLAITWVGLGWSIL